MNQHLRGVSLPFLETPGPAALLQTPRAAAPGWGGAALGSREGGGGGRGTGPGVAPRLGTAPGPQLPDRREGMGQGAAPTNSPQPLLRLS